MRREAALPCGDNVARDAGKGQRCVDATLVVIYLTRRDSLLSAQELHRVIDARERTIAP